MAATGSGPTTEDQHPALPPQATMGLLAYLSTHTLDEDYAFVSERRAERLAATGAEGGSGPDGEEPHERRIGLAGAAALVVFALLVVTAALQTSRNASADEQQRRELAAQVDDARQQLQGDRIQVDALRSQTDRLQRQRLSNDQSAQGLLDTLQRLGGRAGTVPVRGPGVRVVADDAPDASSDREKVLDSDLQRLVNGFWQAGAEAIAVNGQRLTALSAIRLAGVAITVNARSLRRPYVVTVIGNKDTLPARFAETSSGQAWLDLQREVGLRLTITPESSLRLPAADLVSLHYANQQPGGTS